eukprot:6526376-Prorocentrum_lima.AAC.1
MNYSNRVVCLRCQAPHPGTQPAKGRAASRPPVMKRPTGAVMQPPPPSGFGLLPQPGQPASSGGAAAAASAAA